MKNKNLYLILCFIFLLSACGSSAQGVSPVTIAPLTPSVTATPLVPFATSVEPRTTPTNTPDPLSCWNPLLISPDVENPTGFPVAIGEGLDNTIWVLYHNRVAQILKDGTVNLYKFQDFSDCGKCMDITNETMAISSAGDAWIGTPTGLLVVKKNGEWEEIPATKILPSAKESLGLKVLLSDKKGNIWVSNANTLCSYNGSSWKCKVNDGVDEIISAVDGKDDQIWFGTTHGKIILFNGKEYDVSNLNDFFDTPISIKMISSVAFDGGTGSLWAASSTISSCSDTKFNAANFAVFRRNPDGSWQTFAKDLFMKESNDSSGCGGAPTSIAVAKDGKVWLGMMRQLGLAYYDGVNWKALDGKVLPYDLASSSSSNNSCVLPTDDWTTDVLVTRDGKLLVANRFGVFMYTGQ